MLCRAEQLGLLAGRDLEQAAPLHPGARAVLRVHLTGKIPTGLRLSGQPVQAVRIRTLRRAAAASEGGRDQQNIVARGRTRLLMPLLEHSSQKQTPRTMHTFLKTKSFKFSCSPRPLLH